LLLRFALPCFATFCLCCLLALLCCVLCLLMLPLLLLTCVATAGCAAAAALAVSLCAAAPRHPCAMEPLFSDLEASPAGSWAGQIRPAMNSEIYSFSLISIQISSKFKQSIQLKFV
jgi:hypothetical protein